MGVVGCTSSELIREALGLSAPFQNNEQRLDPFLFPLRNIDIGIRLIEGGPNRIKVFVRRVWSHSTRFFIRNLAKGLVLKIPYFRTSF